MQVSSKCKIYLYILSVVYQEKGGGSVCTGFMLIVL